METTGVPGDVKLPLEEHLQELTKRTTKVILVTGTATAIIFLYSDQILLALWKTLIPPEIKMVIYSPLELILTRLILSLVLALTIGVPLAIYEAFLFTRRGLYPHEKKYFLMIVPPSLALFFLGAAFALYIAIPLVFKYTILASTGIATPQISLAKTFSTITTLLASFGLIFQLPLLVTSAIKMKILEEKQLRKSRIIVYGVLLTLAVLTTPDPSSISVLLVAVVFIALFELSLLISKLL